MTLTIDGLPDLPGISEVAEVTGIPLATLRWYRATDQGPRSIKVGRHVRYRKADVLAWLAEQEQKSARGGVR